MVVPETINSLCFTWAWTGLVYAKDGMGMSYRDRERKFHHWRNLCLADAQWLWLGYLFDIVSLGEIPFAFISRSCCYLLEI